MDANLGSNFGQVSLYVLFWLIHFAWIGLLVGAVAWVGDRLVQKTAKRTYNWSLYCFLMLITGAMTAVVLSAVTVPRVQLADRIERGAESNAEKGRQDSMQSLGLDLGLDLEQEDYPQTAGSTELASSSNQQPIEVVFESGLSPSDLAEAKVKASSFRTQKPLARSRTLTIVAICISIVYVVGCCLMLVRLLMAGWGCRRLARGGMQVTDDSVVALLQETALQIGLKLTPILATCERIVVPVVIGVFRPVILLPASIICEMAPEQLRAILAHEMAHLKRFDHVVVVVQRIIEAVLFFHPTTWWFSRRLDRQRELCCDDLAMQAGTTPLEYAETLYLVARWRKLGQQQADNKDRVALAVDGANASQILVRISRVLDETLPVSQARVRSFGGASASVGFLLVCLPVVLLLMNAFGNYSSPGIATGFNMSVVESTRGEQDIYGSFRGVVRDENGDAVTGATVVLQEHPSKYLSLNAVLPADADRKTVPPLVFAQSTTGMDGEFEFSGVEIPGFEKYYESSFPITVLVIHDDYAMTWKHLEYASKQKIEYTLKKAKSISFKTKSGGGKPLENVTAKLIGMMTQKDWNSVAPYRRIPAELIHQGVAINPTLHSTKSNFLKLADEISDLFVAKKTPPGSVAVFEVGAKGHASELFYVTNFEVEKDPGLLEENLYGTVVASGATLELRELISSSLKVVDFEGNPISGVEVEADKFLNRNNKVATLVRESAEGLFELGNVAEPDGKPFKLHVKIKPPADSQFLMSEQLLEIDSSGKGQSFVTKLKRGIELNGRVVDAKTGKGIEGVPVRFRPTQRQGKGKDSSGPFYWSPIRKSDANGEFVLRVQGKSKVVPDGKIDAAGTVEGYQTWAYDENKIGRLFSVAVTDANKDESLVLKLEPASKSLGSVRIKVLDDAGKPAEHAIIRFKHYYANSGTGWIRTQRTNGDGVFDFDFQKLTLNFESLAVVVVDQDKNYAGAAVYQRPENIKTVEDAAKHFSTLRKSQSKDDPLFVLTVNLKPIAKVVGQVVNADTGEPVPFVKVQLSQEYRERRDVMRVGISMGTFFPLEETDEEGRYELKAIPELKGYVNAEHPDFLKRRFHQESDYLTPGAGEVIERNTHVVPKEVSASARAFVAPDLGDRKGIEALEFLKSRFSVDQAAYQKRLSNGDADDAHQVARYTPAAVYIPAAIALADENRDKPVEVKALVWACKMPRDSSEDLKSRNKLRMEIGKRLLDDHISSPEIIDCLTSMVYSQPRPKQVAEKISEANKDIAVQGNALLLIGNLAMRDLSLRGHGIKKSAWSNQMTDEELEAFAHKIFTRIKDEYADVPYWRNENLGTIAKMQLFEFDHLGVGDLVEDIVGKDVEGMPLKLSDYRGKIVLLDFWGSWCGPCIMEIPKLNKIAKDFSNDVVVLGMMNDNVADAKEVIEEHDVKWRNWVEPDDGPVQTRWNISSWPTTYVIGPDGKILAKSLRGRKLYDGIKKFVDEQNKKQNEQE